MAWHFAMAGENSEVLQKFWEWATENLTTGETNNKLLLGTDIDEKTA